MIVTFLGTSAATSYPSAFCNCTFCMQARNSEGKDFRKRSSIIINNDLLIDFGPDVVYSSLIYKKPLTDIRYLLQTHPHSDHFDASHLSTRVPEYLGVNIPPLEIYASQKTLEKMSEMMKNEGYINNLFERKEQERMNLHLFPVKHYQRIRVGGYEIVAFPSEHDRSVDSLIYSVTQDNVAVLYATDTDEPTEEMFNNVCREKMLFNIIIFDHTYGFDADSGGHLNANRFIRLMEKIKKNNLLASGAKIFATHISHEGNPTYDKLSESAKKNGYEIAYDGLVVNSDNL